MDIKVVSQNRISLVDISRGAIGLYGQKVEKLNQIVYRSETDHMILLGEYESEGRAKEVFEEMLKVIEYENIADKRRIKVYYMPEE